MALAAKTTTALAGANRAVSYWMLILTHKPSAVVFPIDEVLEVVESCCYAFESKNVTANKQ